MGFPSELNQIEFGLPIPPSVNDAYAARPKSHLLMKTAAYRAWLREVEEEFPQPLGEPRHKGLYDMQVLFSAKFRGDIDNRLKLLSDVLGPPRSGSYGLNIVADDRNMVILQAAKGFHNIRKGRCIVIVRDHLPGALEGMPWAPV